MKEKRSHVGCLEALPALRDARLPRLKTREEFDFNQAPQIPAAKIRKLVAGGYVERAESIALMEECGTGKTQLAMGRCVATRDRVREVQRIVPNRR